MTGKALLNKAFEKLALGLILAGAMVFGASTALAQDSAAARGQETFEILCEPCHGKGPGDDGQDMLPGTSALQIKYNGELPPALEDRSDLSYELIRTFLRQGSFSMPPFRPTDITDEEIRDVAAYLDMASSG